MEPMYVNGKCIYKNIFGRIWSNWNFVKLQVKSNCVKRKIKYEY